MSRLSNNVFYSMICMVNIYKLSAHPNTRKKNGFGIGGTICKRLWDTTYSFVRLGGTKNL